MVTNRNDDDNVQKMQPEMDAISHVGQRSADERRADQGMTRAKTRQEQKAPRFSGCPPIAPVVGIIYLIRSSD
jgi:hypothetical protein